MRQISNCWVDIEKGYRQALLHEFNLKKRYSNIIQSIERKRVLELESIMLSSKVEQEEKRRKNTQKLTPLFLIGSGSILFSLFVLIFIGLIYHIQENNPVFRILLGSLFLIFIGIFIFGLFPKRLVHILKSPT